MGMPKSQKQMILAFLQKHGSITADEAQMYCKRCHRLAARISELRADGHNIITDYKDAAGKTVNYAIYRLIKEENHE
jgi:hypothetical protein